MEKPDNDSGVFTEATAQAGAGDTAPAEAQPAGEDTPQAPETDATDQVAEADATDQAAEADADAADQEADGQDRADEAAETAEPTEKQASLADLKGENARLADDLARARADYYNLEREYSGYVRRSKRQAASHREDGRRETVEALLGVLDDIEAARQAGELSGPFAAIATKLEQSLASACGLERFGEAGDAFDPACHDALMASESDEVSEPTIAQVLQPGYRMGERVLRPTKVMVHNPT